MDIRLKSGLVFHDAEGMLRERFELRKYPWNNYDRYAHNSNVITPKNVEIACKLMGPGEQQAREAWRRLLRQRRKIRKIERYLSDLPKSPIESIDLCGIKNEVIELFNLVCGEPGIKLAGATKLLYLKRPGFLSVIDSIVEDYYWYGTGIRNERRFRLLQRKKKWGEYVFELLMLLREDVLSARTQIDSVLRACAGETFAAGPRVRVVESLIWYYYDKGGSTEGGPTRRPGDRVTK